MNLIRGNVIVVLTTLLLACSEQPKEKPQAVTPHDHVWSAQTRALEKAQAVEQQTLDAAAAREREIDQQSR